MSSLAKIFNVLKKQGQKVRHQFKGDTNPVFNLGHDMTPDVDSKNMKILVDCVHTFSKRQVL
jgi:uroporphyrinogen-III decarboxylase